MTLTNQHTATHKRLILAALEAGKRVDLFYSLEHFACSALRSRIADLRRDGHPIETEFQTQTNRVTGRKSQYAVYRMS